MRPIVITAGPLAAASATQVATAQRNFGAGGALALLGAASNFVAGTVAATQAPGSSALTINGTRALNGVANLGGPGNAQYIYINSSGNDSGITFKVVGTSGLNNMVVTETITGTSAQSAASVNAYNTILSITPSGAVAANVTVGTFTAATLDTSRQLVFTTTGNESANTATITGADVNGNPLSETVALANIGTTTSILSYYKIFKITVANAAVGNISVGTNGVASSQWARMDGWAPGPLTAQFVVSGVVNYDVQSSMDDPNSPTNPVLPAAVTWDSIVTGIQGATTTNTIVLELNPIWLRIVLNSGTGSVTGTILQAGVNPI